MASGLSLRVALVHGPGSPERDGVSDYVSHLRSSLVQVGVDAVSVQVQPGGGRRPSPLDWLRAVVHAGRQVRGVAPDVVHVQFAPSVFAFSGVPGAALPAAVGGELPLVTTVHEYGWWCSPSWVPNRVWSVWERLLPWDRESGRLLPASAAVVCTNHRHARQVAHRTGRDPHVVALAPNVDVSACRDPAAVRRRWGIAPDATVVAFFGFVHPVKGLRYAIEALSRLRAKTEALHLLVIGGFASQALPDEEAASFRRELQETCSRHRVADRVTFTGHLPADEVSQALSASDIGLLPFTEGVTTKSGALLTLLRHGLPTLVTRAEPADPLLVHGHTVHSLSRVRSADAVALALQRLLDDGDYRLRLAGQGRRLGERYAWDGVVSGHRAVYESVLRSADA